MRAYVLERSQALTKNSHGFLTLVNIPVPVPNDNEILIKVDACGVCRTDLDEIEGRLEVPKMPVILGHQIVGSIVRVGENVKERKVGEKVGVGWFFSSCGQCFYCKSNLQNLCQNFCGTGCHANGGYAEYMLALESSSVLLPDSLADDVSVAAPLLCAGSIGYRSLKLCNISGNANLGLTGFGASGHLILKMVSYLYPEVRCFVFARNEEEQKFALELGAFWSGHTNSEPPELLDAIIDTTPAWLPVVNALSRLKPGGRLVINAIRKDNSDKTSLLNLDYGQCLWREKEIKSVANVTSNDIREFIAIAHEAKLYPEIEFYFFDEIEKALLDLKFEKILGAKVIKMS